LPELETVYQANKDKGLVILGIATTDDAEAVQKVIAEKGITFPIVLKDEKIQESFGGEGSPETFIISTDGNITEHIKGARGVEYFTTRAEQLLTKNN
jgi:peroxiredoxin